MKAFMEEYGLVIVVIIVVAALIGLAMYFKRSGKSSMTNSFDNFVKAGDEAVKDASDNVNNSKVDSGSTSTTNP